MYGSSLMLTTYAGIYNARTKKINLWNTAPVDTSQRFNREAFVLCEAEEGRYIPLRRVSPWYFRLMFLNFIMLFIKKRKFY